MNKAIIALGSNIMPRAHIDKARTVISEKFIILAESEIVETKPVGYKNQPNFLNCTIKIETALNRSELKQWLTELEIELGRIRTSNKYGPRKIDLDIIVWNEKIVDDDVYKRDFLKNAVKEVCAEIVI